MTSQGRATALPVNIDHERCRRHFINQLQITWSLLAYYTRINPININNSDLFIIGWAFKYYELVEIGMKCQPTITEASSSAAKTASNR
jgi:hypothetical protein